MGSLAWALEFAGDVLDKEGSAHSSAGPAAWGWGRRVSSLLIQLVALEEGGGPEGEAPGLRPVSIWVGREVTCWGPVPLPIGAMALEHLGSRL